MKRRVRALIILLLAAVFTVSSGMLVHELIQYRQGEKTYDEAKKIAKIPDFSKIKSQKNTATASDSSGGSTGDPYAGALSRMDFTALKKVNSDIFGWILIPNTVISYPLLDGNSNRYYLQHTWKKQKSVVGAIFLEQKNSASLSEFNTIVYGHNMKNGSMFGTLKKYGDRNYWKAHPFIYLTTSSGSRQYEIFAAYEVSTQGKTYQVEFSSEAAKASFLSYCRKHSVISTGISPKSYDYILTLSTCTGHGHTTRWVVQARLPGLPERSKTQAKTSS